MFGVVVLAIASAGLNEIRQEVFPVAKNEVMAEAKPKPACETDKQRGFDFWLGEWRVTTPSRPKWSASSHITSGNNGCSIHEAYKTPQGYEGTSVNFYDKTSNQWHQTWIDNQGNPLYLNGNVQDGKMVLSDGANEITWTPLEDGRVRQHWLVYDEKGESKTAFDGYYERVSESP